MGNVLYSVGVSGLKKDYQNIADILSIVGKQKKNNIAQIYIIYT